MSQATFEWDGAQSHHTGMLSVQMNPRVRGVFHAMAAAAPGEAMVGAPGLAALENLERAGLVRSVIRMRDQPQDAGPIADGGMAMMAAGVFEGAEDTDDGVTDGALMIQLERDADVDALQAAFMRDPACETASRVPIRYLAAAPRTASRKTRRKPGASTAAPAASPPSATPLWNLQRINWLDARAKPGFRDADQIRVAVLDSGIQPDHPDLDGLITSYVYGHPNLPGVSGPKDYIGHGTHVAGTIAAAINNAIGIQGVCRCELRAWKIFDDETDYSAFSNSFVYYVNPVMYRRALADCIRERVDVINLSIGGPARPDPQEQRLFDRLIQQGCTIVAAMGNGRQSGSRISYPAKIRGVIAVGATNINDRVASFSNRGAHISVAAPGVGIWSTLPTYPGQTGFSAVPGPGGRPIEGRRRRRETDYDSWNGTSMATPHVAGAAALTLAKQRLPGSAVKARLEATADKVPGMGGAAFHPDYGYGRINLSRLIG